MNDQVSLPLLWFQRQKHFFGTICISSLGTLHYSGTSYKQNKSYNVRQKLNRQCSKKSKCFQMATIYLNVSNLMCFFGTNSLDSSKFMNQGLTGLKEQYLLTTLSVYVFIANAIMYKFWITLALLINMVKEQALVVYMSVPSKERITKIN